VTRAGRAPCADPGAGKTTLLRHFAFRLAGDAERPWVPLFASLPRWIREPDRPLAGVGEGPGVNPGPLLQDDAQ